MAIYGPRKADTTNPIQKNKIPDKFIPEDEHVNASWKTPDAAEIFQEIKRFCSIQKAGQFSNGLASLRQIIKRHPQALNQINFSGMTLLDIALSMPKFDNEDKGLSIRISEELFDTIIEQMNRHLSVREFKIILANKNKNNFMLLQRAISCGSPTMVNKAIDLLQEEGHEQLFIDNLNNVSSDGFSCLQQAYMTGNPEIIDRIWNILLMQEHEKALRTNLSAITHSGFSVLTTILRNGTDQDFQLLTSVFLKHTFKSILRENLNAISIDQFTPLLSAIRSGSLIKVRGVIGLLSLIDDPRVVYQNLVICNKENYSPLSSSLATGVLEMVEMVITFYEKTGAAKLLRDHLEKVTADQSNPLQIAIGSKSAPLVAYFIRFLQRRESKPLLDKYLMHRTGPGFMLLQDVIKAAQLDVFQQFVPLWTDPANHKSLGLNLANFTRAGFTCLGDAIKTRIPEMVDFVVSQSEQHLDSRSLRGILSAKFGLNNANALLNAVNTGNEAIVESILQAIRKEYGAQADEILRDMLKDVDKLWLFEDTQQTRAMVAKYLPASHAVKQEPRTNRIMQSLSAASILKNEKEFNDSYKSIKNMITQNPEFLTEIGITGWSFLNVILRNPDKYQSDKILAEKMTVKLFLLFWEHMQRLPREQFLQIIRAQRTDANSGLLAHVLMSDYTVIVDMIVDFYAQPDNKELLQEQLGISDQYNCFLQKVMIGKSVYNFKKALALLTMPGNEWHLRLNLAHRGKEGYRVLHDTVRKSSTDIFKSIVEVLLKEENRDLLELNLQNCTDLNFTLLQDAIKQGNDKILQSVIELSEQYLDPSIWRQRLLALDSRGYNILHKAVNNGSALSVGLVFHAIIRAFGRDARNVLKGLLHDRKKFRDIDNNDVLDQLRGLKRVAIPTIQEIPEIDMGDSSEDSISTDIQEVPTPLPTLELKKVTPCGGIGDKYLGGTIPALPEPLYKVPESDTESEGESKSHGGSMTYLQEYSLHVMGNLKVPGKQSLQKLLIDKPCFQATFYGAKPIASSEQVTFVIAGRQANALIPHPHLGRCVLVVTEKEYPTLKARIPVGYDTLVLRKISSNSHGEYKHLGLPTSRRLGAFLFAHFNKLNSFAMIDDNIQKVRFNSRNSGWDNYYKLLEAQLENHLCVSVATFKPFNRVSHEGQLGSKLFMVNMKKIRQQLPTLPEIFSLFPCQANADYWGEDYYMQLMFHVMSDDNTQGYDILEPGISCLLRSKQNRNAFARLGKLARSFDEFDKNVLVSKAIALLNEIIQENIQRYQRHLRYVINANLQVKHALANQLQALQGAVHEAETSQEYDDDFITRYQGRINRLRFDNRVFRPYQIQTLKGLAAMRGKRGRMLLATGSGKTFTQCELMRIAYHTAQKGEHIIVVTPHIKLVEQFYKDFINFNQLRTTVGEDLWIPPEAIIKVCSNRQSCQVKALLLNKKVKNQTCVLIFCADSFDVLLEEMGHELPNVPVILFDEYHYYNPTVKRAIEHLGNSETLIVGATATPPKEDVLKPTLYSYTRAQGVLDRYLASVIADCFDLDYSKENVDLIIKALPLIIKRQYHPGLMDDKTEEVKPTLGNSKGIIYLPSIKDCDKAYEILKTAGIKCFTIHSENKKNETDLNQFLQSDEPGILLAVKMLRIGFNATDLAWTICLQNGSKKHESRSNVEQILGRVMRKKGSKLGYVICFKNVLDDVIKPLLADQPVTLPVNPDYLAQHNVYYMNNYHTLFIADAVESKMKKIVQEDSGLNIMFKIVARPIKKFAITASPHIDEHEEAVEPQSFDDVLAELTYGFLSDEIDRNFLVSYQRSKYQNGRLSQVIDRMSQGTIQWVKRLK